MLGPAGNRIQVVENTGRTVNYTYDDIYRLTEESIDDPASGTKTISYTYDSGGNRLTKTDDGVVTNYTYDANDRLLTEDGTSYSYDDNGNMVSKVSASDNTSYSYDFQNRLIEVNDSVSSVAYAYDSDGIRTQSIVNGNDVTRYIIDKNRPYAQVLEERDSSDALVVSYVYGDDLISQNRGGVDFYYHYDGQLSTRALSDSSEAVTDTYSYDAFGDLLAQTGITQNNFLYTGEQYDPNVGFYYLRARYYDAGVGRFTTTDPWQGSVFDPASLHRYLYAGADPVNKWDPSGKVTLGETIVVTGYMSARSLMVWLSVAAIIGVTIVEYTRQPIRLNHYTRYEYYPSIYLHGLWTSRGNYFTTDFYSNGDEAQDKLAMSEKPNICINLTLYWNEDNLQYLGIVESNEYGSGGGKQYWTPNRIPVAWRMPKIRFLLW